jgi:hypothetical protein
VRNIEESSMLSSALIPMNEDLEIPERMQEVAKKKLLSTQVILVEADHDYHVAEPVRVFFSFYFLDCSRRDLIFIRRQANTYF